MAIIPTFPLLVRYTRSQSGRPVPASPARLSTYTSSMRLRGRRKSIIGESICWLCISQALTAARARGSDEKSRPVMGGSFEGLDQ